MIKKLLIALLGLLFPIGLIVATEVPASADTPGCVSDGEYQNTDPGEKMSDVHARYDTDGWLVDTTFGDGYRYQHRQYVKCAASDAFGNRVNVQYRQAIVGGEVTGPNTVIQKWRSQD